LVHATGQVNPRRHALVWLPLESIMWPAARGGLHRRWGRRAAHRHRGV